MAFSDSLTEQQKADCLLARGMDFDTYIQRMLDSIANDAANCRRRACMDKIERLPEVTRTVILATIDNEFEKVKPEPIPEPLAEEPLS